MQSSRLMGRLWLVCAVALASLPALAQEGDFQKYEDGRTALDGLQWQKAVSGFEGLSAGSALADGALYWKAFALYKLGQGQEALAAVAELRKAFPQSGWLPDAGTLATAIPRSGGADPSAKKAKEPTADERQRALAERVRQDPSHAAAILGEAVFGLDLPGARQKALYSLSREKSPEAHEAVLQVARGAANPDLQSYAIAQLGAKDPQAAFDLYPLVKDKRAKSVILAVLTTNRDSARLMRIASSETSDDLRYQALSDLVDVGTEAQVKQALQFENAADVKMLIEAHLANLHKWVAEQIAVLQTAKDVRERRAGAVGLTQGGDPSTDSALVAAYGAEKDPDVKEAIVFTLSERRAFAALESMERNETDPDLKLRIGAELDTVHSK